MRKHRFLWSSLYSWGVPLVICVITFAMQNFIPESHWDFRPDLGLDSCFFTGRIPKWIYFYGPMALIICANLLFFMLTFAKLVALKINTNGLKTNRSRLETDIWYYKQYFKLFSVTGLSWGGEVIGFTFKRPGELERWEDYVWLVLDAFNSLQGIYIFIIFVCPKQTRKNLKWLPGNTRERGQYGSRPTHNRPAGHSRRLAANFTESHEQNPSSKESQEISLQRKGKFGNVTEIEALIALNPLSDSKTPEEVISHPFTSPLTTVKFRGSQEEVNFSTNNQLQTSGNSN